MKGSVLRIATLLTAYCLSTACVISACGGTSGSAGERRTTEPPAPQRTTASPAGGRPVAPAREDLLPKPYQPLWPFADLAQVRSWQERNQAEGIDAWRLSAERTALAFTRDYLRFREIDRVVTRKVAGTDAHIGVGYQSPETHRPTTVAVIHLLKVGEGGNAPWEVVGTDDPKTFTLDRPAYGAGARSPITVGGQISGVDESIRLQIRQASSPEPLGRHCCTPAGGTQARWSAKVAFRAPTDTVLTVIASTGGHIADIERFAVTAIRPS